MDFVLKYFFESREIDPFYMMPLYNFDSIEPIAFQRFS